MKKIGFIGMGIMGSRMAAHLITACQLSIYSRDKEKANSLIKDGAVFADSLQELATGKDIIFTMLSTPEVVQQVAFGEQGFVQHMSPGSIWVDCSTVDPPTSRHCAIQADKFQIKFLDAPVAGTKQPAENGELVFFVGGKTQDINIVSPFLELMGKKTVHLGDVASGTSMKMIVNLMLGQSMQAFTEAVQLGKALNLNTNQIHNVLLNAPVTAPFLKLIQGKLETADTAANFPLKWMSKDLNLASALSNDVGLNLPLTTKVADTFKSAVNDGMGDEDFSSIYHYFES